jgi:hypothetical protein
MSQDPDMITGEVGGGRIRAMRVNYEGNSHKGRQQTAAGASSPEREAVTPVTTNPVNVRKKGFFHKFSDAFFGETDGNVTDYIIFEVLVPALKNMVSDAISGGVNKMLYGDDRRPSSSHGGRPGYTSYHNVSRNRPEPRVTTRRRGSNDPNEIITQTRGEAEDVLDQLRTLISQYEFATVADLYKLAGMAPAFTDENWGWTDLRSASIRPAGGGYLIVLPKPQPLA